jgi:hypothetical protein
MRFTKRRKKILEQQLEVDFGSLNLLVIASREEN